MMANVAVMVTGRVRLEITVAVTLRRKMKMTVTTSTNVKYSVSFTSCTDSRMVSDRSVRMSRVTDGGSCSRNVGSRVLIESTTATTFDPGCLRIERLMLRRPR